MRIPSRITSMTNMRKSYHGHLHATCVYLLEYVRTGEIGPLPDGVSIYDFRSDLTWWKNYLKKKGIDMSADIKKIRLAHRKK